MVRVSTRKYLALAVILVSIVICESAGAAPQGEWRDCGGTWTNKPCEAVPKAAAQNSEKVEGLDVGSKIDFRPRIVKRPAPEVTLDEARVRGGATFDNVSLRGAVKGHGTVRVDIMKTGKKRGHSRMTVPSISKVYRLPASGGSAVISEKFPLRDGWRWSATARNEGRFSGYHDLSGCCEEGIAPVCEASGLVRCGKLLSSACRCGS